MNPARFYNGDAGAALEPAPRRRRGPNGESMLFRRYTAKLTNPAQQILIRSSTTILG
jgi:hypothetical protein